MSDPFKPDLRDIPDNQPFVWDGDLGGRWIFRLILAFVPVAAFVSIIWTFVAFENGSIPTNLDPTKVELGMLDPRLGDARRYLVGAFIFIAASLIECVLYLLYATFYVNDPRNSGSNSLGLPQGTVRVFILIIVVLALLLFALLPGSLGDNKAVILLFGILSTVVGFYYGSAKDKDASNAVAAANKDASVAVAVANKAALSSSTPAPGSVTINPPTTSAVSQTSPASSLTPTTLSSGGTAPAPAAPSSSLTTVVSMAPSSSTTETIVTPHDADAPPAISSTAAPVTSGPPTLNFASTTGLKVGEPLTATVTGGPAPEKASLIATGGGRMVILDGTGSGNTVTFPNTGNLSAGMTYKLSLSGSGLKLGTDTITFGA